jgi:thioesterase domain-containing protein
MRLRQPEGPYFLAGWSLGGVLAFEMARQLEASGQAIAFLGLMDSSLPSAAERQNFRENPAVLASLFARDLASLSGKRLEFDDQRYCALDDPGRLAFLKECLAGLGALPQGMSEGDLRKLLDVFGRHAQALASYSPGSIKARPVLFVSEESAKSLEASQFLQWSSVSQAGLEVRLLPGDHYSLLSKDDGRMLAQSLDASLKEIAKHSPKILSMSGREA